MDFHSLSVFYRFKAFLKSELWRFEKKKLFSAINAARSCLPKFNS